LCVESEVTFIIDGELGFVKEIESMVDKLSRELVVSIDEAMLEDDIVVSDDVSNLDIVGEDDDDDDKSELNEALVVVVIINGFDVDVDVIVVVLVVVVVY
jgi:hypothetical protein